MNTSKNIIINVKPSAGRKRIFSQFLLLLYINRCYALPSLCEASHNDGWGEGFEQQEIETDDFGKLYISFYGAPNWSMKSEEEMDIPDTEVQNLDDGDISM